jgi:hypothetical protein
MVASLMVRFIRSACPLVQECLGVLPMMVNVRDIERAKVRATRELFEAD